MIYNKTVTKCTKDKYKSENKKPEKQRKYKLASHAIIQSHNSGTVGM